MGYASDTHIDFPNGIRCRCVWAGGQCSARATQEDGLCDWCGTRRPEDLKDNPNAMWDPVNGEYLGLGGRGYDHVDPDLRPDACWMPGSRRTFVPATRWDPAPPS